MINSGYFESIGCARNNSSSNESFPGTDPYTQKECVASEIAIFLSVVFGSIGCIMHSYIIFCYNFKRYEAWIPIETLITSLSSFDLLFSFGLVVSFALTIYPDYDPDVFCSVVITILAFYRWALFMVVFLLASNRYYAVCKPRRYGLVFASRRIVMYSLAILGFGLLIALGNQIYLCYYNDPTSELGNFVWYFMELSFDVSMFALLTCIVVMYVKIFVKLRHQISVDEAFNAMSGGGVFDDDLQVERSYLKAITISSAGIFVLLVLDYIDNVITDIAWSSDRDSKNVDFSGDTEYIVTLFLGACLCLLFVSNPVIFCFTNQNFRIKLIRPIRALKAKVKIGGQLKIAELNTNT